MFCLEFQKCSVCADCIQYSDIFCARQTQNGASPVYAASRKGHTEVLDILVQAGADIHLATTDELHVSTHAVSSSVAEVAQTNVLIIEFVVYDPHFH